MKNILSPSLLFILISLACITCTQTEQNGNKTANETENADTTALQNLEDAICYLPSPYEIITYIETGKIKFNNQFINPLNNKERYITTKDKIINIGVYSADVAYLVFFEKNSELGNYFKVIDNLCKEENIASGIDQKIKDKIINSTLNADTLTAISNEVYKYTLDNILEKEQKNTYALLLSGAFVETLYLIIKSADTDPEYISKRIIEQKLLFDDLLALLQSLKKNKNISDVILDMENIKMSFSKMNFKTENLKTEKSKDNKLVLSGNNSFEYSKEAYENLQSDIIKLRTKWTKK
ncbi:MAG: hypothetical protein HY958_03075 [Bacteroidia bacterium]|nr:hypothetical protein [Bacteroidia bacterium]